MSCIEVPRGDTHSSVFEVLGSALLLNDMWVHGVSLILLSVLFGCLLLDSTQGRQHRNICTSNNSGP